MADDTFAVAAERQRILDAIGKPAGTSTSFGAMGWLSLAGSFIETMGLREQGKMARIAGERQRANAEFDAWQLEEQAGEELAVSQRMAIEERRQAELAASRALAVAATSGAGVSDPSVVRLLARTQGEGAYRANVALYQGESRARQARLNAAQARITGAEALEEGHARDQAYGYAGMGRAARGALSLYARYGQHGPGTTPRIGGSVDSVIGSGPVPGAEFV